MRGAETTESACVVTVFYINPYPFSYSLNLTSLFLHSLGRLTHCGSRWVLVCTNYFIRLLNNWDSGCSFGGVSYLFV